MKQAKDINESISWKDITPGAVILEGATASLVKTGDWRVQTPIFLEDKCTQCLLCIPVCPDMAIELNEEGQRSNFNLFYCKGCGICANVCPFQAITLQEES